MNKLIDLNQYKLEKQEQQQLEDEKNMQRQYDEFISLLKYFVFVQEIKHELITIEMTTDKLYTIYNDKNEQIGYNSIDVLFANVEFEDIIVSQMIEYSAKNYVIKSSNNLGDATKETLSKIFGDKVTFK